MPQQHVLDLGGSHVLAAASAAAGHDGYDAAALADLRVRKGVG
ncbi:MAG TPA: hypothetical protein VFI47_15115 [Acidimicrobiales bacterium]|nr:hypothetical protein [Acidimicrobiales bacterium]